MASPLKAEYFWDIDLDTLDHRRHEHLVVSRLLNYGSFYDWRWLIRTYGQNHLRDLLRSKARLGIREPVRRLALIILQA